MCSRKLRSKPYVPSNGNLVLADQGRAFKRVFEGAQETLRLIFGMQMVELPVRDKVTKEEKRKGKHAVDCDHPSFPYRRSIQY